MKRALRTLVIFSLFFSSANLALAQTTATWDFGSGSLSVSSAPTGATASNFSVNVVTGNGTGGVYRTTNWTLAGAIDLTNYYEVTMTPTGGNRMDFTTFVFDQTTSATGPNNWAVRSSVDAYATNIATAAFTRGTPVTGNSVDISALTNQTGAVTFRIYCWGATAAGGQFDLDNVDINGRIYRAIEPTQSSFIDFTAVASATQMTLHWTDGDGGSRGLIGNGSGPVAYVPVDGSGFTGTANADITNGGSLISGTDHLLTITTSGTTGFTVTGLVAGQRYHFRIYERNGTGSESNFNTATATHNPVASVQRTASSNLILTPLTATTMQVNWTNGTGNLAPNRIVVARAGAAIVDFPVDGTPYTANNDIALAPELVPADGHFVVASGTGPATISGLTAGVVYHFRVFEVNTGTNYSLAKGIAVTGGNPRSVTQSSPTTQALNVVATGTGTLGEMALNWTNGNGNGGRIVLMKTSAFVGADMPVNGEVYTHNLAFGSGSLIGGARVVFQEAAAGTGGTTGIVVTGLNNNQQYFIKVLEYDGTAPALTYNIADGASNNPVSRTTPVTLGPGTSASLLTYPGGTSTSINLGWTQGNGTGGRIVLAKPATTFVAADYPLDGVTYTGNADYTLATPIGPNGSRVVYNDAIASTATIQGPITISGLDPATLYFFQVIEFNGTALTGAENYRLNVLGNNPSSRSTTVASIPVTQAFAVTATGNGTAGNLVIRWSNGSGSGGRVVVLKPNSAIVGADNPVNGASYVTNLNFSTATAVGPNGAKVVYREASGGTGGTTGITVTNLGNNALYHIKVYEFDGTLATGQESYATVDGSSNNPINRRTYHGTEPGDATNIVFGTTTSSSVALTWTNGSYTGLTVTGASGDATTATLTFAAQAYPLFSVGSTIRVAGVNPAGYNATAVVTASTTTSVSYANATVAAYVSGGNIQTGGRVLIVKPAADFVGGDRPVDGVSYTYNGLNYGAGTAIAGAGSRVVYAEDYSGTGSTGVTVTGLTPGTSYRFFVVEFAGEFGTGAENFNVTGGGGNANTGQSISTPVGSPPATQATAIAFTPTTSATTLQFGWTNGNGVNGRIAIIKATNPIVAGDEPVNGTSYTGNQAFGSAPVLGAARVIYSDAILGTGQATAPITVTGLTANTLYYVKVFEFNGAPGTENYQLADGVLNNPNSATTNIQPTATYAVTAGTTGNAAINADFTVTFNVPVRFVSDAAIVTDAEIKQFLHVQDNTTLANIAFTASINGGNNVITIVPADSNIPGNKLTGSRDYNVFIDVNEIETSQNVPLAASNQVIVATTLAAPTNQPTAPTISATINSVTIGWTDALAGAQLPENYLIVGIENGGGFPGVIDGTDLTTDLDFADGAIVAKVALGVQSLVLNTGVKSGQPYDFRIYSYTNEAGAINYNTVGFLTPSITTGTGNLTTVENGGGTGTVASTINDLAAATAAAANFTFDVHDDGGTDAIDNAPTRITGVTIHRDLTDDQTIDWTDVIGGVIITDGTNPLNSFASPGNFTIGANSIIITGIPAALGLVADNATKPFQVKIWLQTSITGLDIDGKSFVFNTADADFTVAAINSSTFTTTGAASSGAGNNETTVIADRLAWTPAPIGTQAGTPFTFSVSSTDVNGNVDLDINQQVTASVFSGPAGGAFHFTQATPASGVQNLSSGRASWTGVKVTAGGTYTFRISDTDVAAPAMTLADAAGVIFTATDNASNVVVNGAFGYPGDIDYKLYQNNPVTAANGLRVAEFIIQDGGGAADVDQIGTTLTNITFTINNPGNIRRIGIHDGTSVVAEQAAAGSVAFSGLSLLAEDVDNGGSGTKTFSIYVTFNAPVTDNQHFDFLVTAVATGNGGSRFLLGNGGGAQSSTTATDNRVVVTRTHLVFGTQPVNTYINFPMAPVTVRAVDILGSLDTDFIGLASVTSSGSLTGSPVSATFIGGIGTYSTLTHVASGAGFALTTVNGLLLVNSISNTFDILAPTNASDIQTDAGFANTSDIAYENFQSSNIGIIGSAIDFEGFLLRDGAGGTDADPLPTTLTSVTFSVTNPGYIRRAALYDGATELAEAAPVGGFVTLSAFAVTAADGTNRPLTLRVSFTTAVVDNQRPVFTVTNATYLAGYSGFAAANAGAAASSTTAQENQIEVFRSELRFLAQPVDTYVNFPMTNVTVRATDLFGNLDVDFIGSANVVSSGTLTGTPVSATFVAGVGTYAGLVHTVVASPVQLSTTNALSLANGFSNLFSILAPNNQSDIITNTGFANPTDIAYETHQENTNIVVSGSSIAVEEFNIRDGAGAVDLDPLETRLTALTLSINNPTYIRRAALYDGGVELAETTPVGSNLVFTGFSANTADGTSKTLSLRVSFNTTVVDNQQIVFTITSASFNPGYSGFSTANAGGAQSSTAVGENRIEVTRTKVLFVQQPTTTYINTIMAPAVTVEATDGFNNRDLDFTGTINITSSGTLTGTPVPAVFAIGLGTYSTLVHTASGVGLTLSTTNALGMGNATSNAFTILPAANNSDIITNTAFANPSDILYLGIQENTNIVLSGTSIEVERFDIRDGGGVADVDPLVTTLTAITFSVSNPGFIRRAALYDGITELAETTPSGGNLIFTGFSVSATDDLSKTISLRVSYTTSVVDNVRNVFTVTSATTQSGFSGFALANAGGAASSSIGTENQIEAVATRLDFTSQQALIQGKDQPINFPAVYSAAAPFIVVEARDANAIVDLDHNFPATVSSSNGALVRPNQTFGSNPTIGPGKLDLADPVAGIQYRVTGSAQLTVTSNGLTSNAPSIPSNTIDVIDVEGAYAPQGVTPSQSLPGGSVDQTIFGFTLTAPHQIGGPEPRISGFTIQFGNPITSVLINPRLYESLDNFFSVPGAETDLSGSLSQVGEEYVVSFGAPRPVGRSYFLVVDIDGTASNVTLPITPALIDQGYPFPLTNGNIVTTSGSATATVIGLTFNFASIFPPLLVSSYPAKGQSDLDPTQSTLDLVFTVPVGSMDGIAKLYDQATDAFIRDMIVTPGGLFVPPPPPLPGTPANPLKFTLGALNPNTAYYVTIAQGNTTALTGIRDQAGNLFAGISYSGTLFFKTSDGVPPAISLAPAPAPQAVGVTASGATIGATFDKVGKAYYMVLASSPTDPTVAQIKNPVTYLAAPVAGSGSFDITKTKTIAQYGNFAGNLANNTTYEVWMVADGTISKNGISNPIPATGVFGGAGSNYASGSAGPTFTFLTPNTFTAGLNTNAPAYLVCKNAIQDLNIPLVLSEDNIGDLTSGSQEFYLVLPANFNFNILEAGNISVTGTDVSGAAISYLGSGILKVTFTVDGSPSTRDVITISGLQVISTVNASGPIIRIAGSGSITGVTNWGTVTTYDTPPITFDNSYSRIELGNLPTNVVTTIPDNYDQVTPNLPPFIVELIPPLPSVINDFGSNAFSGPGVNINRLSLTAVTLGAPFNIVLTHTDENGCVSTNSEQYTVYDHNTAITGLPTETCATNGAYLTPPVPSSPQVTTVVYNNLGAFYMDSFKAKIPTQPATNPFAIDAAAWNDFVSFDPGATGSTPLITRFGGVNPNDDQFAGKIYYDYRFDNRTIVDAATVTTSGPYASLADIRDPYEYFKDTTDIQGHIFYRGGSLGIIEFNAVFQSIANSALRIPLRQNLRVYLPPVPIVEVEPPSRIDSVSALGIHGIYGGTPVFCQNTGTIEIEGHPRAGATSTGFFLVFDDDTDTPLTAGFTDNTNGTATINPLVLFNNYEDIRIEYHYLDDAADSTNCGGSGFTIIRISPKPVAGYALDQTPHNLTFPDLIALGACENSQVTFDGSATDFGGIPGLPGTLDPQYRLSWIFNDANSTAGTNPNTANGTTAVHTFIQTAQYNVSLTAESSDRCLSDALVQTIRVGKLPEVNTISQLPFTYVGTSVGAPFLFTATAEITSAAPVSDGTLSHDWTWGDGSPVQSITSSFATPVPHTYTTPGRYFGATAPTLRVTSVIGCVQTFSRPAIVLDQFAVDSLNVYREGFATNANWQYWQTETATSPWNLVAPSWAHGVPTDVTAITDPNDGNDNVWTTNLSGPYNSFERSALYSPSFDLSGLRRPLITFNSIVQMESGDGVVVQYSTDNLNVADPAKVWSVLGIVGGGVDWYNTSGLPSKPGDQLTGDLGWSGKKPTNPPVASDPPVWIDSKYALADNLGNLIQGTNVVFRFAIASSKTIVATDGQGFVLDNVRIGERTRTILLESFASTSNANVNEKAQNDSIASFNAASVGVEVVKINYHLNFPAKDPFNELNPADPSSRALYYGVTQTPYSVLDGKNDGALWSDWGPEYFNTRSLQLAEAELKIYSSTSTDSLDITAGGKVGVYVQVIPRVLGGLSPNTILHVAVTEQNVPIGSLSSTWQTAIGGVNGSKETQFEFVLKKLLPSAAGTRTSSHPNAVAGILQNGVKYVFGPFEYVPLAGTTFAPNTADMAVAVFLQNELSRDIYQSEIIGDRDDPTVTVTGLEPIASDEVAVYPNPANREMTIRLPGVLSKPAAISLIDQTGRPVLRSTMAEGTDRQSVNVSDLAGGVYILTVDMGQGTLTRKKVMVVHQD